MPPVWLLRAKLKMSLFILFFIYERKDFIETNQPKQRGHCPKSNDPKIESVEEYSAREWATLFAGPTRTIIITAKVFDSPKNPKPTASFLILQGTSNPLLYKASMSMQFLESP